MQSYIDTAQGTELAAYIKHMTAEVARQAALSRDEIMALRLTPAEQSAALERLGNLITAAQERLAALPG